MAFLIYLHFSIPLILMHSIWKWHGWFPFSWKWVECLVFTFIKRVLFLFWEWVTKAIVWILLKTVWNNWWRVLLIFTKNIFCHYHWVFFWSFERIFDFWYLKRIHSFRSFKGIDNFRCSKGTLDSSLIKRIRFGFGQWLKGIEHFMFLFLKPIIIKKTIRRVFFGYIIITKRRWGCWWLIVVLEEWRDYFISYFGGWR